MGVLGVGSVLRNGVGTLAVHAKARERFDHAGLDLDLAIRRVVGQLEGPSRKTDGRRSVSTKPRQVPGLSEEQSGTLRTR